MYWKYFTLFYNVIKWDKPLDGANVQVKKWFVHQHPVCLNCQSALLINYQWTLNYKLNTCCTTEMKYCIPVWDIFRLSLNYIRSDLISVSFSCIESHVVLRQYLHIVFRYHGPFPSRVTQKPFFINWLQIGYNIPNLKNRGKKWVLAEVL